MQDICFKQLNTLFILSSDGRLVSTREINPCSGPLLAIISDGHKISIAINQSIDSISVKAILANLPLTAGRKDIDKSMEVISILLNAKVSSGPTYCFPSNFSTELAHEKISSYSQVLKYFNGWKANEIQPCQPMIGKFENQDAISVCFSARISQFAAEAGVETNFKYRRIGHASILVKQWAQEIARMGLTPLYSTNWENKASLGLAKKLGLIEITNHWSIDENKKNGIKPS